MTSSLPMSTQGRRDARQRGEREEVRPPPEQHRDADGDDEPTDSRCAQPGAAQVGQEIDAQPSPAAHATRPARRADRLGPRYSAASPAEPTTPAACAATVTRRPRARRRQPARRARSPRPAACSVPARQAPGGGECPAGGARAAAQRPAQCPSLRDREDREPSAGRRRRGRGRARGRRSERCGPGPRAEVACEVARDEPKLVRPSGSRSPPATPNQSIVPVVRVPSLRSARAPATKSSTEARSLTR